VIFVYRQKIDNLFITINRFFAIFLKI